MSNDEKALATGKVIQEAKDAAAERDLLQRDVAKHISALEKAAGLLREASTAEKMTEPAENELMNALTRDLSSGEDILEAYRKFKIARDSAAALKAQAKNLVGDLLD